MEKDNVNKTKTYFVILLFIIIILLSAFVVIEKTIMRSEENTKLNSLNEITNNILEDSVSVTELSLNNKYVNKLYKYIDNIDIEYILYLNKEKELTWDTKSLIALKNIDKNTENLDVLYIEREEFENVYYSLFEEDVNNLSIEDRTSSICGSASYDFDNDLYVVNLNCSIENNMKTFYKNITYNNDKILINKYYIFTEKNINDGVEEYNLYTNDKKDEGSLLISNIKIEDISSYISKMNVLSYIYSKGKDGNYYLTSVK